MSDDDFRRLKLAQRRLADAKYFIEQLISKEAFKRAGKE